MSRRIKIFFVISFLIHILFLFNLLYHFEQNTTQPSGSALFDTIPGNVAMVEIESIITKSQSQQQSQQSIIKKTKSEVNKSSGEIGNSNGAETSSRGAANGNQVLQTIRNLIFAALYYPNDAKLLKITGRPVVEFSIAKDGKVQNVRIVQKSGSQLLDDAAITTIIRAAPLPAYDGVIRIPIKYDLKN